MLLLIYYLTIAVWSKEAFASFVQNLANSNLFRAFSIVFLVNVTLVSIDALRALWRTNTKLKFILALPLTAGLILLLLSFFMSVNMRETVQTVVGLGDTVEVPWDNDLYRVERIEPALKKHALKTDESLIFDYEPAVTLRSPSGELYGIRAFPPSRVRSTYVHILNFGIGPYVELYHGNDLVSEGYVPLRLTPYGSVDRFDIAPYPYRFYLSIVPTRVVKKGREAAREYDLERPVYGVTVTKGDTTVAKGETADRLQFDGSWTVRFLAPADWVLLEAVSDPFLPGIVAGLVLVLLGLPCLLLSLVLFRRKSV